MPAPAGHVCNRRIRVAFSAGLGSLYVPQVPMRAVMDVRDSTLRWVQCHVVPCTMSDVYIPPQIEIDYDRAVAGDQDRNIFVFVVHSMFSFVMPSKS
jgi:hypothetical protein